MLNHYSRLPPSRSSLTQDESESRLGTWAKTSLREQPLQINVKSNEEFDISKKTEESVFTNRIGSVTD